jgi:hypothetical protein
MSQIFLNKLTQFEKKENLDCSVGIVTGYGVANELRLIDYKGAEPRNTSESASCVRGGEGFDDGTFVDRFSVITLANTILLPSHMLYEMPSLQVLRRLPGSLQLVIQQNGHKFRAYR